MTWAPDVKGWEGYKVSRAPRRCLKVCPHNIWMLSIQPCKTISCLTWMWNALCRMEGISVLNCVRCGRSEHLNVRPWNGSDGWRLPQNPQELLCFSVGIDVLQGARSPACKSVQLVISVKCLGTPVYLMLYKCQLLLQFLARVIDSSPAVLTGMEWFEGFGRSALPPPACLLYTILRIPFPELRCS